MADAAFVDALEFASSFAPPPPALVADNAEPSLPLVPLALVPLPQPLAKGGSAATSSDTRPSSRRAMRPRRRASTVAAKQKSSSDATRN